ncbi:uncharacterized protein LOC143476767 [Brachyhypopomus gauderio]|uniref:uncharacterized protein LOC143476767 n=1 Tax=Brachyhypopomus gauderio TaxID=698409 RepID=UPI004042AA2C
MEFDLEQFVLSPSVEALAQCRKADLLSVAGFYNVSVARSARKAEIRKTILERLREERRLPVSPDTRIPAVAQAARLHGLERASVAVGGGGLLFAAEVTGHSPGTSPGMDVDSPPAAGSLSDIDLNMAVRLKELDLAIKQEEWQTQLLRVRALEESEVDSYFTAFERVAATLHWPKDMWSLLLQCKLVGKVQEVCSSLTIEQSLDYDRVKAAVLRARSCPGRGQAASLGAEAARRLRHRQCRTAPNLHVGAVDTFARRSKILKEHYRSLLDTARKKPSARLVVSGPFPTFRRGRGRYKNNRAIRFKNLIKIKLNNQHEVSSNIKLRLGLLNIRSLASKAVIVNKIISDNRLNALCLTETWARVDEYVSFNEAAPPGYSYVHQPRITGRGGGVATIYDTDIGFTVKPTTSINSFEALIGEIGNNLIGNKTKLKLVTIYRPPGPYSEFLQEFAEFLSELVLTIERFVIVGDFNIHYENESDPLKIAFDSILDSVGIAQNVTGPTHRCKHTLDLILTYELNIEHLAVIPQNDAISDHSLLIYEMALYDVHQMRHTKTTCTITSDTAATFINLLPELPNTMPLQPNELEQATQQFYSTLSNTLDSVAPVKTKLISEKKLAPWYDDHTRLLKQAARAAERKWKSTSLEVFRITWKDTIVKYKHALIKARAAYYSTLIENNKNNPRFLFATVSKLTRNINDTSSNTALTHTSDEFLNFFNNKIDNIRLQSHNTSQPNLQS